MTTPPRLATRILERRLTEPTRTYLLGDLEERHAALARRSALRAWLWYWRQTILALATALPGPVGAELPASGSMTQGLRHAVRALWRRPGTTAMAALPLGLGIGVVATAFSIVWGTVLAGLPFPEADRLVHFERVGRSAGQDWLAVTPHDYTDWRAQQRSFEDLGAYVEHEIALPSDAGPPERRVGVAISAGSFPLLRAEAAMGRTFTADDEVPGSPPVIILSHGLWTARFAADPAVVGREIEVDGRPTTVVGVMPPRFGFPIAEEFWAPLQIDLAAITRGEGRLDVFGRLREGVSLEAARGEFEALTGRLAEAHPETNADIGASLRSFEDEYVGDEFRATVYRLLAGALLVLLVCCANVANLLLVRGFQRRDDLAVRRALGATRGHLVSQFLLEALVIAGLAALVGVSLAWYGVAWFNRVATGAGVFALPHGSDSLFWWDVGLNVPTLVATVAVAGLAGMAAGVVPALVSSRPGALTRRGSGGSHLGGQGLQRWIVASQVTLTTGLLVTAGFVTRSVGNVSSTFDRLVAPEVTVMGLALPGGRSQGRGPYDDPGARIRFLTELEESLASDPAVAVASFTTSVPLQVPRQAPVRLEGDEMEGREREVGIVTVSPTFFQTFGVQADEGRLLSDQDGVGAPPSALVNRSFAERFLPGRSAVGSRLRLGPEDAAEPWLEVVGVVPDLWDRPDEPDRNPGVYLPLAQVGTGDAATRLGPWGLTYPTLAIRSTGPGAVDAALLGRHVSALDPTLPLRSLESMEGVADRLLGRYEVWGSFWLTFAAATLLLAGLGIYGVLSFVVTLRTGEIGIRRALGASSSGVQRAVVLSGLKALTPGVAIGLVLGKLLTNGIGHVLYGVDAGDPVVFATVATLVMVVGVMASWLPARRAAGVDPRDAMRA